MISPLLATAVERITTVQIHYRSIRVWTREMTDKGRSGYVWVKKRGGIYAAMGRVKVTPVP